MPLCYVGCTCSAERMHRLFPTLAHALCHSFTPAVMIATAAGETVTFTEARRTNIGNQLTLLGDNFAQTTTMLCRFDDVVVQATFLNGTAVQCAPTQSASGAPFCVTLGAWYWNTHRCMLF